MIKFVLSIPDDLFARAERLARKIKKSRSRLLIDVLKEYLASDESDRVTEAVNSALVEVGKIDDRFVSALAQRILEGSEW